MFTKNSCFNSSMFRYIIIHLTSSFFLIHAFMKCVITQRNHIILSVSGLMQDVFPTDPGFWESDFLHASFLSEDGHDIKNPSVGARLPHRSSQRPATYMTWCLVHRELTWTFLQVLVRLSKDIDKTQWQIWAIGVALVQTYLSINMK